MGIPDSQRVMVLNSRGAAPEPADRPIGAPGRGEVLVKVNATSLNYHDSVNLAGLLGKDWPRIPMVDGAGEIVTVGPGVTGFTAGDRVIGAFHPDWLDGPPTPRAKAKVPGASCDGWLQQYRVAEATGLVATPGHLTDLEAATLPCAGVTAWNALREAGIGPGDVVVSQGTGGVSLFTVQFAHALGATVILTSSSDDKLAIGARLGATHSINYRTTPDWERQVEHLTGGRGADLVVDLGGTETLARSVRAAGPGGTVAVVGVLSGFEPAHVPIPEVLRNNLRIVGITVGSVRSFAELCGMVDRAGIKPHISHVFDWSDLDRAVRVLHAGEHIGKIALTIP